MAIYYATGLIGSLNHNFGKSKDIFEFSLAVSEDKKNEDGSYEKLRTNWVSCKFFIESEKNEADAKKLVVGKRIGVFGFAKVFPFADKKNEVHAGIRLNVKLILVNEEIKEFEQKLTKLLLNEIAINDNNTNYNLAYEAEPNSIIHSRAKESLI